MGAFVEHDFKNGFLLDEQRLRKLRELIEARISKYPTPLALSYKVFRDDSYSYETKSVDDVVGEDNEDWRAISKLELGASQKDVFDFKLQFSKKGTRLEIVGNDRDAVFLLFSDLRDFIKNDVLVTGPLQERLGKALGLVAMSALFIGFLYTTIKGALPRDGQLITSILASGDLAEKLNFLIEERQRANPGMAILWWTGGMMVLMVLAVSGAVEWIWSRVFPSNIFIFGKRKEAFEKRRALMEKIVWIVAVGLVVSLVAGLIVWSVTRP